MVVSICHAVVYSRAVSHVSILLVGKTNYLTGLSEGLE